MNHLHKFFISGVLSLVVITVLCLGQPTAVWKAPLARVNLENLPLDGHKRLLIVAPHCDDETLGSGGLILKALRRGMEVRVVVVTNGDGYMFATMEEFHSLYPTSKDFIYIGKKRQKESIRALEKLGVAKENIYFLGYPDRGTPRLWNTFWSRSNPYTSSYDKVSRSPYKLTYNHSSVYCGADLLSDLESIISSYRPDLVIYPHPGDSHPDHWGSSAFVRLALAEQRHGGYHPDAYTYLVHYRAYPAHKGLYPSEGLLPPANILNTTPKWYKLDMEREDTALKWQAVSAYHSQVALLRPLMESFVRRNEVFGELPAEILQQMEKGSREAPETWLNILSERIPPAMADMSADPAVVKANPACDVTALHASLQSGRVLALAGETLGEHTPEFRYNLRVVAAGPGGIVHYSSKWGKDDSVTHTAISNGRYILDRIPLSLLKDPQVIFVRMEVGPTGKSPVDFTPWQMLMVPPRVMAGKAEPARSQ
jgi:LmbE family N-acetylglucosaminyl deacetylase